MLGGLLSFTIKQGCSTFNLGSWGLNLHKYNKSVPRLFSWIVDNRSMKFLESFCFFQTV